MISFMSDSKSNLHFIYILMPSSNAKFFLILFYTKVLPYVFCVSQCMYVCVHVQLYACMCVCVSVCICVRVWEINLWMHMYQRARHLTEIWVVRRSNQGSIPADVYLYMYIFRRGSYWIISDPFVTCFSLVDKSRGAAPNRSMGYP